MGDDIISVIFLAFVAIVISAIVANIHLPHMGMPTFIIVAVGLWISYDYILLKRYQAKEKCSSKNKENFTNLEQRINSGIDESFDYQNLKENIKQNEDDLYFMSGELLELKKELNEDNKIMTQDTLKPSDVNSPDVNSVDVTSAPSLTDYNNTLYVPLDSDDKPDNLYDVTKSLEYSEPQHKNEFDINYFKSDITIQDIHKDMGSTLDNKLSNRMKYMGLQNKISKDTRSRFNRYTLQPYFEEELRENENRDWWNVEQDYLDNYM